MDTKKLRQKILDLAIHGKLVPQDPNDEPASVLLERIKAEKERLIKEGKIKKSKKSVKASDTPHYTQLPDGWQLASMSDICSLVDGKKLQGTKYPNLDVKYLRGEREAKTLNSGKFVSANTLMILVDGENSGEVFRIPIDGYQGSTFKQLSVNDNMNIEYVLQVINLHRKILRENKVGSAIPHLNKKLFKSIEVPIPPLSEQQRIVMEIEKWFALIDQIEQSKVNLQTIIKQAKSKILDLAIHGKLAPQDPNDEPAIELLKRINPDFTPCDNGHYTQLPDGWQLASMSDICSLVDGKKLQGTKYPNLDVKYLRGEREAKTLNSGKFVSANTLMILVDGENSGEVFRTPIEGYQGSTFKLLSINDNMNTDYVLQVINLHRKTLRENKVGSAIPHLNKKLFKAIEVPIPPYKEQQRIVDAINRALQQLDIITESL